MKKLKIILFIFIFLILLTGCKNKINEENKFQSSPLFFEVSKDGSDEKIYLLGSIHAADESVYPLPNNIMSSYKNSDYLAVEFDIVEYTKKLSSQMAILKKFMYTDGTNIKDYVSIENYDKMKQILKDANLYSSLYNSYKPIIWDTLIETAVIVKSELKEDLGIDMYFLNQSKEDNKKILELESADLQYNVLLSFSDELVLKMLDDSINNYEENIIELKELYEAYKKGDRNQLESLVFDETDDNDKLLDEYNDALVTKRNIGMFNGLEQKYNEGNTIFCTVGLAHIIGKDGLVSLFEQNGYTVVQK